MRRLGKNRNNILSISTRIAKQARNASLVLRKQVEEALRQSEQCYRQMFENNQAQETSNLLATAVKQGAFVKDVPTNSKTAALTQALIGMARSLNLNVIAEGVETEEELKFLLNEGCDTMQGYLFSRPLPTKAFEELLQSNKSLFTSYI